MKGHIQYLLKQHTNIICILNFNQHNVDQSHAVCLRNRVDNADHSKLLDSLKTEPFELNMASLNFAAIRRCYYIERMR